jgi:hypothetical protein
MKMTTFKSYESNITVVNPIRMFGNKFADTFVSWTFFLFCILLSVFFKDLAYKKSESIYSRACTIKH